MRSFVTREHLTENSFFFLRCVQCNPDRNDSRPDLQRTYNEVSFGGLTSLMEESFGGTPHGKSKAERY